jgi:hypothetical protein
MASAACVGLSKLWGPAAEGAALAAVVVVAVSAAVTVDAVTTAPRPALTRHSTAARVSCAEGDFMFLAPLSGI